MPARPKIFLETTVLKYAAERLIRGCRVPRTFRWGDAKVTIPLARWYEVYPNDKLPWRQRWEIASLPLFAWLASNERVELVCNDEVRIEFWGLPKTDDPRGLFYGAPITRVRAPITYSRIVFGGFPGLHILDGETLRYPTAREHQIDFLSKLHNERFLQLQKATGAHQGARKNTNQLLDAFHIWCAEGAGADFFLTLDRKLLRHLTRHRRYPPTVRCVTPIQLLSALRTPDVLSWFDVLRFFGQYARQLRNPATNHPLENLLEMSRRLDKAERPAKARRWFGAA